MKISSLYKNIKLYKVFIYLSLIFLLIVLIKADYLKIPVIYRIWPLIISLVLLVLGHFSNALYWKKMLKRRNFVVSYWDCLISGGISVFGKYIPGKIWSIVGRAVYISEKYDYSLTTLSFLSVYAQIIGLWTGLTLGGIGLMIISIGSVWLFFVLISWIGLTIVIFSPLVKKISEYLIKKIFKKEVTIPLLSPKDTLSLLLYFFIPWIIWSVSFLLLVYSLTEKSVDLSIGLGFPLAATFGIMAVFAPGGLGIREGILMGYLKLAGFTIIKATTISVTSRLWFLTGDMIIFIFSVLLNKRCQITWRFKKS